jgi:hypothetical protein
VIPTAAEDVAADDTDMLDPTTADLNRLRAICPISFVNLSDCVVQRCCIYLVGYQNAADSMPVHLLLEHSLILLTQRLTPFPSLNERPCMFIALEDLDQIFRMALFLHKSLDNLPLRPRPFPLAFLITAPQNLLTALLDLPGA